MTLLKTDRLLLRPIQTGDAPALAKYCNDLALAWNTARIPHPYTLEAAKSFVAVASAEFGTAGKYRFAICRAGSLVGCIGLEMSKPQVYEIGYWIGGEHQQRGYASEAAAIIVDFAATELDAKLIGAGYFEGNMSSRRILEKLGFLPTGETVPTLSLARNSEVNAIRMELKCSKRC